MKKLLKAGFLLLIINSAYLASFASPDIFYMANVLFHVIFGVVIIVPFLVYGFRLLQRTTSELGQVGQVVGYAAYSLMILSMGAGLYLIIFGNLRPNRSVLYAHIATAVPAVVLILVYLGLTLSKTKIGQELRWLWKWGLAVLALGILLPTAVLTWSIAFPNPNNYIENPERPPSSMNEEGMFGKDGPFFPSSAETSTRGLIPSTFFMTSDNCGQSGCHPDIFEQWNSSAHHFSSFNNQWYRKSIEYMQDVIGIQPSKWCAGCHDPAVLFNGMFDRPVREIVDTPEAQAGITCNGCHAIVKVKDTMGNGGYYIEYPPLHDLAVSKNPLVKGVHDFLVKMDPAPHKRTFLKPFHREQTAEFCSACHKVHLDKPVNNYRWFRGFNEYDNWQASGVSGQGARSFYYPPKPQKCADCHMPLTPSKDAGNIDGFVHNHRFPGANTALPIANQDEEQLKLVTEFLQDNQLRIDIFAMTEPGTESAEFTQAPMKTPGEPQISSTFGIGEEQGMAVGVGGVTSEAVKIIAPLDNANAVVRRGDSVRLDVVVRTLKVGHFFPGGTVDAFDVWIELKAVDDHGKTVFWSGAVRDNGKGPVEQGAHFYKSYLLDGHGNPINKRNAWAARSVMYVNLIPPGAADVAHYRLHIPEDCGDKIFITAKLNYRKFMWWNTQFAFAGVRDPSDTDFALSPHYDDGRWLF
ncbi:MAG: hypothetical protein GWN55_05250, partial [Phycisphaerae bacterium]|nr:hypothetical protein [candidate division KSB1 bacterium]NIV00723.1 hypothetical protein [Phycisphaerae bacterium]NIR71200.1 hypothetical protein [candidate division KSB1 bacterium]NIT71232.1 hypothetical protein [candidate division KSB1 bacterium]NIU24936.1 hypothetical protein [candidate division KSB1 bacterium]